MPPSRDLERVEFRYSHTEWGRSLRRLQHAEPGASRGERQRVPGLRADEAPPSSLSCSIAARPTESAGSSALLRSTRVRLSGSLSERPQAGRGLSPRGECPSGSFLRGLSTMWTMLCWSRSQLWVRETKSQEWAGAEAQVALNLSSVLQSNMLPNWFTRNGMPLSLSNLNTSTPLCIFYPPFCFLKSTESLLLPITGQFSLEFTIHLFPVDPTNTPEPLAITPPGRWSQRRGYPHYSDLSLFHPISQLKPVNI